MPRVAMAARHSRYQKLPQKRGKSGGADGQTSMLCKLSHHSDASGTYATTQPLALHSRATDAKPVLFPNLGEAAATGVQVSQFEISVVTCIAIARYSERAWLLKRILRILVRVTHPCSPTKAIRAVSAAPASLLAVSLSRAACVHML